MSETAPTAGEWDLSRFLGWRTLIVGEVNSGKTVLTQRILDAVCRQGLGRRVLALDLAPEIPESLARQRGLSGIGGRLTPPEGVGVRYLWARPLPPRLSATSEDEASAMAEANREAIERLMGGALGGGRDVVFLNDVTLYLQAGGAQTLMEWLASATTVVANGYYGRALGGGALSQRERRELEALMDRFGRVIRL